MQSQAVLVKIGIMVSMMALASTQAQASDDHNVLCAAYMDIAVEDLYPVGAIPHAKALEMTTGRYTRLATTSLLNQVPIDEVVTQFTSARNSARTDLYKRYPQASSSASNLYRYASGVDAKTNQHCIPSNADIMDAMGEFGRQDLIDKAIAVSKVMSARGES